MLEMKCQENARAIAQQIKTSGGNASMDYSNDPHVIGKWVDGETDVYEVTLSLTSPSTPDVSSTIHSFDNIINVVEFDGIIDGQYGINTYWDGDTHIRTWFNVSDEHTNIRCNAKGSLTLDKDIIITVRYTISIS